MFQCPSQGSRSEGNRKIQLLMKGKTWIRGPSSALEDGGGTHQNLPGYSWEEADAAGHKVIIYRSEILECPEGVSPKGGM